jgi:hypothetical protein
MGDTMAISRADLFKELLPELNEAFRVEHLTEQVILNELKKAEELEDAIQE